LLNLDLSLFDELPCLFSEQTPLFCPGQFISVLASSGFDLDGSLSGGVLFSSKSVQCKHWAIKIAIDFYVVFSIDFDNFRNQFLSIKS
jgi:hypothetical protein